MKRSGATEGLPIAADGGWGKHAGFAYKLPVLLMSAWLMANFSHWFIKVRPAYHIQDAHLLQACNSSLNRQKYTGLLLDTSRHTRL